MMTAMPASRTPIALAATLWRHHQARYLVVAGCTTLFYLAVVWVGLRVGLPYMAAILTGHGMTIPLAFPLYRRLVFESVGRVVADFGKFLTVWGTGGVAGLVGTPFLVEVCRAPAFPAHVAVIVLVAVGSYLGHRFWTFRHRAG